jgi:DNA-binding transcriptional MerR regulator
MFRWPVGRQVDMDGKQGDGSGTEADEWLTTGEMARLGDTTLRTVRFYEAEGLIAADARRDGDHRKFPRGELKKLQIISDLRDAGLSLQEIKQLMALKSGCSNAKQAAAQMTATLCTRMEDLDRRIACLHRVRGELGSMVDMLRVCRDCTHPEFPRRCAGCEMVTRPGVERATQLLWKN